MAYIEMKFCERFGLTPYEYRALPSELVKTWSQMAAIEDGVNKAKQT